MCPRSPKTKPDTPITVDNDIALNQRVFGMRPEVYGVFSYILAGTTDSHEGIVPHRPVLGTVGIDTTDVILWPDTGRIFQ